LRPDTFDGSGILDDFVAHFEAVADLNQWNVDLKGKYLAACLRGTAQGVLGDLEGHQRKQYETVLGALRRRFGHENQVDLFRAQLKSYKRKKGSTLAELCQEIRRLTRKAYPNVTAELMDSFARDQFIDALGDTNHQWFVKQSRPKSLQDAERTAVEYEAFQLATGGKHSENAPVCGVVTTDQSDDKVAKTLEQLVQVIQELKLANQSTKQQTNTSVTPSMSEQQQGRRTPKKNYL
jgi:hypothetical protein